VSRNHARRHAVNGWGANVENSRFQSEPGISVAQLGQLELRWAFGTPGVVAMFGQPTIAGGRVFIAGQNGHVYSLDMRLAATSGTTQRAQGGELR
jgi:polyvinyl alcohol dehydrogenase (cytochrome)